MMTRNSNLEELIKSVEQIRAARYPEIPAEIIRDIIKSEFELQDSRTEAASTVRKIVSDYLKEN